MRSGPLSYLMQFGPLPPKRLLEIISDAHMAEVAFDMQKIYTKSQTLSYPYMYIQTVLSPSDVSVF